MGYHIHYIYIYTYIYIYIHVFNEEIYTCCEHIANIYSMHVLIWSVECDAPGQAAHGLDPSNGGMCNPCVYSSHVDKDTPNIH